MDLLSACWNRFTGVFTPPAEPEKIAPAVGFLPVGVDESTAERTYSAYIAYLKSDDFTALTHTPFPPRETKELRALDRTLEQSSCCKTASRVCCFHTRIAAAGEGRETHISPWLEPCSTTHKARLAMCFGFTLGCLSGQVALIFTTPTLAVSIVSGVVAGVANCSGTYLTLVDSYKKMEAIACKKKLHGACRHFFNSLAVYLIAQDQIEKGVASYRSSDLTRTFTVARELIAKKAEILGAFAEFYSREEEARYNQGGVFDQFFQACEFIVDRTDGALDKITDTTLRSSVLALIQKRELTETRRSLIELQARIEAQEKLMATYASQLRDLRRPSDRAGAESYVDMREIVGPSRPRSPIRAWSLPPMPGGISDEESVTDAMMREVEEMQGDDGVGEAPLEMPRPAPTGGLGMLRAPYIQDTRAAPSTATAVTHRGAGAPLPPYEPRILGARGVLGSLARGHTTAIRPGTAAFGAVRGAVPITPPSRVLRTVARSPATGTNSTRSAPVPPPPVPPREGPSSSPMGSFEVNIETSE